jgi:ferredoxin, 2Fe-2S
VSVTADGQVQTVAAKVGHTVMESAVKNGIDSIIGECGGVCACGTCRVHIDTSWKAITGEASEMERELLEFLGDDHADVRLSCQIGVTEALDGLILRTPVSQR